MAPTSEALHLVHTTLDNTVGAIFVGVVAAAFLFGITTLQMFWYYQLYPKDSSLHKYSVAILWILDAFHLALTIQSVYSYVVIGFGNVAGLEIIPWSIKLQVSVNIVIILVVHSLYALRVWILGEYHRGIVGYLVAFVLIGGFVIGINLAYHIYIVHTYSELERISWVINSSLATSTGIDFIITAAMCFYLWKMQSRSPASRLHSRISTVMQFTLSSGLFTSACSLSALFSYVLLPNTLVFLALEFLLTKLYVVSFLTMLTARKRAITTTNPKHSGHSDETQSPRTPMTNLIPRRYQKIFSNKSSSSSGSGRSPHKRQQFQFQFPLNNLSLNRNHTKGTQRNKRELRIHTATSSFYSGPALVSIPDSIPETTTQTQTQTNSNSPSNSNSNHEYHYEDYLPEHLESGTGGRKSRTMDGKGETSLSDESETITGSSIGLRSPLAITGTSPTSSSVTVTTGLLAQSQNFNGYEDETIQRPPSVYGGLSSPPLNPDTRTLSRSSYPWHAR